MIPPIAFIPRRALALALLALIWSQPAQAQPTPPPKEVVPADRPAAAVKSPLKADDAELEDLLKIVSEETEIATKTRMNGDYVPGIVSVLHGEELLALGARTVWDALSMVPGIEAVRDPSGVPSLVVRGIQFPFNSGNVKVLIDSMPAARDNAGINTVILDLPIQLVDRIEVIRGPGSVVYGDFAYMGLVNVITRKTGLGFYARPEEGGAFSGGFFGGGKTRAGVEYSLSGSGVSGGPTDVPGRRDVGDVRGFGFGSVRYRGFSLSGGIATREVDDRTTGTPPFDGQQTHSFLDARHAFDVAPSAHLELRLNNRASRFRAGGSDLDGSVLEGGVGVQWNGLRRQSWLFDASFTKSGIDNAVFRVPAPARPPGAPPAPPGPMGFSIRDETLSFLSVMAQDTIEASSRLALTMGARLDRYGDVDTRITPRASLVFRASDRNILKFQWAEGFRAPTFFELYSRGFRQSALNFEVNRTAEVNFVHRRPETVIRLTAYRSELIDLIYLVNVDAQRRLVFENHRRARVFGGEIEMDRQLGKKLKAVFNASWFDVRDSRNALNAFVEGDTVPAFMGNLALIAAPHPRTRLTARLYRVGKRASATLPAYSEFEFTATQKGVFTRGLNLRAGLRLSRGAGVLYSHVRPTNTLALAYEFPKYFAELSWSR